MKNFNYTDIQKKHDKNICLETTNIFNTINKHVFEISYGPVGNRIPDYSYTCNQDVFGSDDLENVKCVISYLIQMQVYISYLKNVWIIKKPFTRYWPKEV